MMRRTWPIQLFRASSLLVPSGVAWNVVIRASHPTPLDGVVSWALGALWLATFGALLIRVIDGIVSHRADAHPPTWLEAGDVLTATGSSMAWWGAFAVVLAAWVGWASLSVVGLLGLGVLHGVALYTLIRAGGSDPWRRTSLARGFAPSRVAEGGSVTEELCFREPRVPAGFRLFAKGRVGQRWPLSRYVVESAESGGEVRLERDVGPAHRGEHEAEPLVVWLEDVLGLCHSLEIDAGGGARLSVLPEPRRVEGASHLLGHGGVDRDPRTALHRPTEGSLHLREYQPGDEARRIHWLRSLARGDADLVVRLPDELPPDEPRVRLVLDTFLPGASELSCDAPSVLLDSLVRVWLGTGRALVDTGVRVTLVVAVAKDDRLTPVAQPLFPRALASAQRLGARARWQGSMPVSALFSEERSIVVSHRLPLSPGETGGRWIVVPAELWTPFADPPQRPSVGLLPYPTGSADNRWTRRRQDRLRREKARGDHAAFSLLASHSQEHRAGNFVARSRATGIVLLEALQ